MRSKDLALIAVFAAFYPIIQLMNIGVPIIGGPGIISLAVILGPINGLILGPVNGSIATAIGVTIGMASGIGTSFSPLVVLNRSLGAAEAGILVKKRIPFPGSQKKELSGWVAAALTLIVVSPLYYLFPSGRGFPLYPLFHLTGALAAFLLDGRASDFISSHNRMRVALGVAIAGYCGVLADHALGNIIFIVVIGWQPLEYSEILRYIFPFAVAERITLAILTTLLGTPVLLATRKLGIGLQEQPT